MGGSPRPPRPAPVPVVEDPAVDEARRRELEMARRARGRAATLLADQQTIGAAPVARKMLLGQ